MSQKTLIEILEEQTKLTLADIDNIGKLSIMLIAKSQEAEGLETQISQIKDTEYLTVERKFDLVSKDKTSDEFKELSNAEKRAIKVKDNLAANKIFIDLVQECSKLKTEALVIRVAVDSMKRQHDREVKGLTV